MPAPGTMIAKELTAIQLGADLVGTREVETDGAAALTRYARRVDVDSQRPARVPIICGGLTQRLVTDDLHVERADQLGPGAGLVQRRNRQRPATKARAMPSA
jgi:hypothetical protein